MTTVICRNEKCYWNEELHCKKAVIGLTDEFECIDDVCESFKEIK